MSDSPVRMPNQIDYNALVDGAAIQVRSTSGLLQLTGGDRCDFLQRMTTNNITALAPGQSAVTILTSPTARNLFVFTVLCRADDLLLLPSAGQSAALAKHLRGQIFFMDEVKVHDLGAAYARLRLMGPQASSILSDIGFGLNTVADEGFVEKEGLMALKQQVYDIPGYELLIPVAESQAMLDRLADLGGVNLGDGADAYTARRVELGRPLSGYELTEDYTPLEAGLTWACAENKGCYTGQEIIARQITYDKVTRILVGIVSTEPLEAGAELTNNGRKVGTITSAGYSPNSEKSIALAIVKRANSEAGGQLQIAESAVDVVALPF